MTTQSLRGMANHGPMHWRGDRTGGRSPAATRSTRTWRSSSSTSRSPACSGATARSTPAEMQAFTDFILQVTYPPNPIRTSTTRSTGAAISRPRPVLRPAVTRHRRSTATAATCSIRRAASSGPTAAPTFEGEPQHVQDPAPAQRLPEGRHVRHAADRVLQRRRQRLQGRPGARLRLPARRRVDTVFRFLSASVFRTSVSADRGFSRARGTSRQFDAPASTRTWRRSSASRSRSRAPTAPWPARASTS